MHVFSNILLVYFLSLLFFSLNSTGAYDGSTSLWLLGHSIASTTASREPTVSYNILSSCRPYEWCHKMKGALYQKTKDHHFGFCMRNGAYSGIHAVEFMQGAYMNHQVTLFCLWTRAPSYMDTKRNGNNMVHTSQLTCDSRVWPANWALNPPTCKRD